MAMRAVLKKISPPSNIRFLEGRGRQLIPPHIEKGSNRWGDKTYVSQAREMENWGKEIQEKCHKKKELKEVIDNQLLCLQKLSFQEFKEEEQQRYLKGFQWTYLTSYLHLSGFRRQLVTMKSDHTISVHGKVGAVDHIEFTTSDIGLQSSKVLVLPPGAVYGLPRQTVNGLVCVTTWDKDAFVIYNPSTGETSPWIKTSPASEVYFIGFEFDPTKNEHKVVCISSILLRPSAFNMIVVEVMTIDKNTWTGDGERIWRRLSAVTEDRLRFKLGDPPVYINGSVYWLVHRDGERGLLTEYVVQTQTFKNYKLCRSDDKKGAPPPTLQLMELDGRVGILKRESDYEASINVLFKLGKMPDDDNAEYYSWSEDEDKDEIITLPCAWTAGTHLSIESITGTNIFLIQPESSDCVFCYDRKTKESVRFPILHERERILQL